MPTEQDHFDAARKYQAFYDEKLRDIGLKAPQPTLGETVNHYRREVLRTIKRTFLPQSHQYYKVQMRNLPPDALQGFEPLVLKAAVEEANNPQNVPVGELRKIERFDETGRTRCIDWIGRESFVRAMGRPGRKVVSFNTPQGPVSASGMFLR
jgi:hypothetical protein